MIKDAIVGYLVEQGYSLEYPGIGYGNAIEPPILVSYRRESVGELRFEEYWVTWTKVNLNQDGDYYLNLEYADPTMLDQLDETLRHSYQENRIHRG